MTAKHAKKNAVKNIYAELYEEEQKYGVKVDRAQNDLHKRRPLRNLKKAWESHLEDFDAVDDFYGSH